MKTRNFYFHTAGFLLIFVGSLTCSSTVNASVERTYLQYCASCHGTELDGGLGGSLIDGKWQSGSSSTESLAAAIREGQIENGMPAFGTVLSSDDIHALVIYIREKEHRALAAPPPRPEKATGLYDLAGERFRIEEVARGFDNPWAVDFLPDGRFLMTERPGRLRVVHADGKVERPVEGTPEVLALGQGGMLDVALHPAYRQNGWIYLAFTDPAKENDRHGMTKIVRGRLLDNRWTDQQTIFESPQEFYSGHRVHFGCRIVFQGTDYLFFSIGDRGQMEHAQDLSRPNGKIHRVHLDGSVPKDNPFVESGFPTIFSYGNRNAQGLAIHPETGELWETEHGPRGGDEVNLIRKGKNYGWPIISFGMNYNGTPITGRTSAPGMEQPVVDYTPSIAVCGLDFYQGTAFSGWTNRLLVGALRAEQVRLLSFNGTVLLDDTIILEGKGRVRDVASGPDGAVYVVLNSPDTLIRLVPQSKTLEKR